MLSRTLYCTLLFLFLSLANVARAEFYECRDLAGNITLQQKPCAGTGVKQHKVEIGTNSASGKTGVLSSGSLHFSSADPLAIFPWLINKAGLTTVVARIKLRFFSLKEVRPWVLATILTLYLYGLWYHFKVVHLSFQRSTAWGLGNLFVPFCIFVYIAKNWRYAGRSFQISFACFFIGNLLFLMVPLR